MSSDMDTSLEGSRSGVATPGRDFYKASVSA